MGEGDPLVLLVNGDITHGTRFAQELVSTRVADQFVIARDNLAPWFEYDHLTAVRLIAGTGLHGFNEATTEVVISTMLKDKFREVSTDVLFHALIDVGGVVLDVAHHGPSTGARAWLRGNVARYYLQSLMLTYILRGERPPRLVLRAHYHNPVHELVEMRGATSELYVTPAWCALDEHAQKVTRSADEITIGMNAHEVIDGELTATRCLHHTLDVRQKESL